MIETDRSDPVDRRSSGEHGIEEEVVGVERHQPARVAHQPDHDRHVFGPARAPEHEAVERRDVVGADLRDRQRARLDPIRPATAAWASERSAAPGMPGSPIANRTWRILPPSTGRGSRRRDARSWSCSARSTASDA